MLTHIGYTVMTDQKNEIINTDVGETISDTDQGKRKSLRNILMGTGAIGAAATQTDWKKPVIDHIMVPAHATLSVGTGQDPTVS